MSKDKTAADILKEKCPSMVLFQGIDNDVIVAMEAYADQRTAHLESELSRANARIEELNTLNLKL